MRLSERCPFRTAGLCMMIVLSFAACSGDKNSASAVDTSADFSDGDTNQPTDTETGSDASDLQDVTPQQTYDYTVPLDPHSPWPKFRRDARQTGRSPVKSDGASATFWAFPTGKGIFSSPVIGGDGTIYIGSANRVFYALTPEGTEKWSEQTGEIIDSSALLDDKGRIYFGSGDGILRARTADSGEPLWDFEAHDPAVNNAFINWFEGNVAILPNGDLLVPNDNWFIYSINRDSGKEVWKFKTPDQTWALPAVDPESGDVVVANNNLIPLLGQNLFRLTADGDLLWSTSFIGTLAASPLLTKDYVAVGGFDGFLHIVNGSSGKESLAFPTRDHIYASPALLSDGTLIQASADGTVYALDPASGKQRWAFDTLEPIRSSPAVDGNDRIYLGSGEGRLFVLNSDGTLRWALRLIQGDRNDLNGSPALGNHAVYIGGESGEVFSVPYEYCLRPDQKSNPDCHLAGEALPGEMQALLYATTMGTPTQTPPDTIAHNQPVRLYLMVREEGDTRLALLDSASLVVEVDPPSPVQSSVSGDRRFLTIVPDGHFIPDNEGMVSIKVTADWLVDPEREGLKMTGGTKAGTVTFEGSFKLQGGSATEFPYSVPSASGQEAGRMHLYRLAAPLPTMLPSYNQIGFDSLHFLVGLVEGTPQSSVAWMLGAKLDVQGKAIPDPETRAMVPLTASFKDGLLTMNNSQAFALEVMNVSLAFDSFRISAPLDAAGKGLVAGDVVVSAICSKIKMYGSFLKALGLCNPQTDMLLVAGAILVEPDGVGSVQCPALAQTPTFTISANEAAVTLEGSSLKVAEHRYALLVVDVATGSPLPLDYGLDTVVEADDQGFVRRVEVKLPVTPLLGSVRVHLMQDTCSIASETLAVDAK